MSKSSDRRLIAAAIGASVIAIVAVSVRGARGSEPLDPTVPQTWVVGSPRGAAPMARLNEERTGLSSVRLPSKPRVQWRARVQGGIAHSVAVDASGAVVVTSPIATITQLAPDGKTAWTSRTGATAAATAPVLTSDGTRVVLTTSGELIGFDGRGQRRFAVTLPIVAVRAADPLPLSDGGLIIAAGRSVLQLDRRGSTQATAKLESDVALLLRRGSETLLISDRGDVQSWRPPAEPTSVGSFGGRVDGAALAAGVLTAVVDQRKLVDLDLRTQARVTRVEVPSGLSGAPALSKNGASRVVTSDGLLLGFDRQGVELMRALLEPPVLLGGDSGAPSTSTALDTPPIVVDASDRVGFVRPGLDAGIVDKAGSIRAASGAACLDPVGLAPAGPSRLVLACRSGVVFLLSEAAR